MPSIWPWGALGGALGGFAPPLDIGCRWSVRSSPQYQGCSKVGRCQPKSEGRKPKSEGSPKSEVPKDWPRWRLAKSAAEVLLGFRASGFLRISVFGLRISGLPCGQGHPKPPQGHPKATPRPYNRHRLRSTKPPQGHPKATPRLPQGSTKAPPRLHQGYPKATSSR